MKNKIVLISVLFFTISSWSQNNLKTYLFIGSLTEKENSDGIYVYDFNTKNGELTELEREGNLIDPFFVTISPNKKYLYACTEAGNKIEGSISAFKIDSLSGKLSFINSQKSGGTTPCHVVTDKTGNYLLNSNYTNSGVSLFKINTDGSLNPHKSLIQLKGSSIHPNRQKKSHMHSTNFSPDNKYAFGFDLGTDKINTFSFNSESGAFDLKKDLIIDVKKGSGPRHFTFHPNKPYGYCINELNGTVTSYSYNNGKLTLIGTDNSYSKSVKKYSSADIHISPDGKFLYASNRKEENSLSIFKINPTNGQLSLVGHQPTLGKIPRSFVIDPTGNFVLIANKNSNEIVVFKRDCNTGKLKITKNKIKLHKPTSLKIVQYNTP